MINEKPVFLTIKDLMARYNKARATIYRMKDNGQIPLGTKFGQSIVWRESDLLKFEDELFGANK